MYIKMFETFKEEYNKINLDYEEKKTHLGFQHHNDLKSVEEKYFSILDDMTQSITDKFGLKKYFNGSSRGQEFTYVYTIHQKDILDFKKEALLLQDRISRRMPEFSILYTIEVALDFAKMDYEDITSVFNAYQVEITSDKYKGRRYSRHDISLEPIKVYIKLIPN